MVVQIRFLSLSELRNPVAAGCIHRQKHSRSSSPAGGVEEEGEVRPAKRARLQGREPPQDVSEGGREPESEGAVEVNRGPLFFHSPVECIDLWFSDSPSTAAYLPVPERLAAELPTSVPQFSGINFLAARNSHARDKSIRFVEKSHRYYCQWGEGRVFTATDVVSVSGLVHSFFPEFDADAVLRKLKSGRAYHPGSKYWGLSDEEIKTMWTTSARLASEQGTKFHYLVECFYNGMDISPFADFRVVSQFLRFHRQHVVSKNLYPFRSEMRLRTCDAVRVTGTIDALFVEGERAAPPAECGGELRLHMKDWKFSKEIKRENRWEQGLRACASLPNCNFSHYALQQNLYKFLLETYYSPFVYQGNTYDKVRVVTMQLVVCHDSRDDYELVDVPDLTEMVLSMLAERREALVQRRGDDRENVLEEV